MKQTIREVIKAGKTALGIEFGSTRIKAVLIDDQGTVLAIGFHDWENRLENGIWTYSIEDIHSGLRSCYQDLRCRVLKEYDIGLETIGSIGISAMMHGYLAFDKEGKLLAPFQTWRNSNTQMAADELTGLFGVNIPLRWTIAHLYQRILDGEAHTADLDYVVTLGAYIHWLLTGERVTGIGDASGIFPIDSELLDYDQKMLDQFDERVSAFNYAWKIRDVLPVVLTAGSKAGYLTEKGAALLDESGSLKPGCPFCPPEGDAGTGMVATGAISPRTGNVSVGTSTFAMIVLEQNLKQLHREIDMVTTPAGKPVAMAHANNGTSDLNAWVGVFREFANLIGKDINTDDLYELLYRHSLTGESDCGALLAYGYYSGEGITKLNEGRPLFVRMPDSRLSLANLMRAHLYAAIGAVKIGLDLLAEKENAAIDSITAHGGFFKTSGVGQRYLAAALNAPVKVLKTASEGGAWGIALLALYMKAAQEADCTLETWLQTHIFIDWQSSTEQPRQEEVKGFQQYIKRYSDGIAVEKAAVEALR